MGYVQAGLLSNLPLRINVSRPLFCKRQDFPENLLFGFVPTLM